MPSSNSNVSSASSAMLVEIFRSTASPMILNPVSTVLAVTLSTTDESSYAALIAETTAARSADSDNAISRSLITITLSLLITGFNTVPTTPASNPLLRRYKPAAIPKSDSAVPLSSRSTSPLASFSTSRLSEVTLSMASVLICVPIAVKSVSVETIVSWFIIKLAVLLSPVTSGVTSSPRTYASA